MDIPAADAKHAPAKTIEVMRRLRLPFAQFRRIRRPVAHATSDAAQCGTQIMVPIQFASGSSLQESIDGNGNHCRECQKTRRRTSTHMGSMSSPEMHSNNAATVHRMRVHSGLARRFFNQRLKVAQSA